MIVAIDTHELATAMGFCVWGWVMALRELQGREAGEAVGYFEKGMDLRHVLKISNPVSNIVGLRFGEVASTWRR